MQSMVNELADLLEKNPGLRDALVNSLKCAKEPGIETLEYFYRFLDAILTHIPTEKELMPSVRKFYYLVAHSPGNLLQKDASFNAWMERFVNARGDFLDTAESAADLQSFIQHPGYNMDDYIISPGGWKSYNQFLARQVKPGRRPVAGLCDDHIIVSPADSTFKGQWPVAKDSVVTVKGVEYSIAGLLDDSRYKTAFEGGTFTHSFLAITDYHRFHVPVGGVIKEVKNIRGGTWITEAKNQTGEVQNTDDVGFQFAHTRGLIIIESPLGYVAVMPVGMGHISSVVLTVEEEVRLVKGDEFGWFAFGGSDMIMLFQQGRATLTAKNEKHYKQGEVIGYAQSQK